MSQTVTVVFSKYRNKEYNRCHKKKVVSYKEYPATDGVSQDWDYQHEVIDARRHSQVVSLQDAVQRNKDRNTYVADFYLRFSKDLL